MKEGILAYFCKFRLQTMKNPNHYTVIMAGGVGSRFWPMSTTELPKQFLDILGTGKSLIRQTYERFSAIIPDENFFVVTNEAYRELVQAHLPELSEDQILCEPIARNTAPCVAYAAYRIHKHNPNASMVVAPSDHIIRNEEVFTNVLSASLEYAASKNILVTLGIEPSRPDTGYGYIQYDKDSPENGFHPVRQFTEKPNTKLATEFVESGNYLWNAGIFVWSSTSIIKAFERYQQEMASLFEKEIENLGTDEEENAIERTYNQCESISIDYAILEKADNVAVYPSPFDWSDIGTWNALYDFRDKNDGDNLIDAASFHSRNSSGNMVYITGNKLVALNNVNNLIVVDSGKALLIADKADEQSIKTLVNELKKSGKA